MSKELEEKNIAQVYQQINELLEELKIKEARFFVFAISGNLGSLEAVGEEIKKDIDYIVKLSSIKIVI
jgi:adenylosuccinate lyase